MGDWDYINKNMGGHDENGMPNFVKGINREYETSQTKTYYTKSGDKITDPKAYYSAVNKKKKK